MALPKNPNYLLTTQQAREYSGNVASISAFNIWRMLGKGPKYLKIGNRVFYRPSDIDSWLESSVIDPSQRGV